VEEFREEGHRSCWIWIYTSLATSSNSVILFRRLIKLLLLITVSY